MAVTINSPEKCESCQSHSPFHRWVFSIFHLYNNNSATSIRYLGILTYGNAVNVKITVSIVQ